MTFPVGCISWSYKEGIGMETQILHELVQRGTPDFPVSFHRMDSTHPGYRMRLQ